MNPKRQGNPAGRVGLRIIARPLDFLWISGWLLFTAPDLYGQGLYENQADTPSRQNAGELTGKTSPGPGLPLPFWSAKKYFTIQDFFIYLDGRPVLLLIDEPVLSLQKERWQDPPSYHLYAAKGVLPAGRHQSKRAQAFLHSLPKGSAPEEGIFQAYQWVPSEAEAGLRTGIKKRTRQVSYYPEQNVIYLHEAIRLWDDTVPVALHFVTSLKVTVLRPGVVSLCDEENVKCLELSYDTQKFSLVLQQGHSALFAPGKAACPVTGIVLLARDMTRRRWHTLTFKGA